MADPALDALAALRRLRRVETDVARRDLGESLIRENTLSEQEGTLRREVEAARRIEGEFDREAFVAWFERMHAERLRLIDALREAEVRTAAARTALARHRAAETVAEDALADAFAARDAAQAHRDQAEMEDAVQALRLTMGQDRPST